MILSIKVKVKMIIYEAIIIRDTSHNEIESQMYETKIHNYEILRHNYEIKSKFRHKSK